MDKELLNMLPSIVEMHNCKDVREKIQRYNNGLTVNETKDSKISKSPFRNEPKLSLLKDKEMELNFVKRNNYISKNQEDNEEFNRLYNYYTKNSKVENNKINEPKVLISKRDNSYNNQESKSFRGESNRNNILTPDRFQQSDTLLDYSRLTSRDQFLNENYNYKVPNPFTKALQSKAKINSEYYDKILNDKYQIDNNSFSSNNNTALKPKTSYFKNDKQIKINSNKSYLKTSEFENTENSYLIHSKKEIEKEYNNNNNYYSEESFKLSKDRLNYSSSTNSNFFNKQNNTYNKQNINLNSSSNSNSEFTPRLNLSVNLTQRYNLKENNVKFKENETTDINDLLKLNYYTPQRNGHANLFNGSKSFKTNSSGQDDLTEYSSYNFNTNDKTDFDFRQNNNNNYYSSYSSKNDTSTPRTLLNNKQSHSVDNKSNLKFYLIEPLLGNYTSKTPFMEERKHITSYDEYKLSNVKKVEVDLNKDYSYLLRNKSQNPTFNMEMKNVISIY